jgi:amino acid transporter
MNDFEHYLRNASGPEAQPVDNESVDSAREDLYQDDGNPNQIVTFAPKERFRLGYFDVACLVINRMIGTGIFNSPQRVMRGTNSIGASLLLWFGGTVWCVAGTHVYMEYGLNVPRYTIEGIEQSVPRSGGDLNYLQYVYRRPAYRRGTMLLSTCLFGVGFIALGNMAGNSINFATRVLKAADIQDPSNGTVRGIAIGVATLTCFIHAFSRRGGIWLNNMLAIIKLLILLLIIITAIVVGAGGLPKTENVFAENTSASASFDDASSDANGYAHAFLAIIFSFSGFEQPNYVLGEISRPRRKFPFAMMLGITTVVLLYMAVNVSYMVVVPKIEQINAEGGVAQRFFELSLGQLGAHGNIGRRIFNAFLAISSLGNIIVMTYTAARVKQEIAKEGILPFPKFFAQNTDMSLGRVLHWLQNKGWFGALLRSRWLSPQEHTEKTPVGAFVLHFFSCLVLIFSTWSMAPDAAYTLLTSLSSYVINGFFGSLLGLGILILRFKGPPQTPGNDTDGRNGLPMAPLTWTQMTGKHINPLISVVCATIYVVGGIWPLVVSWIKPSDADQLKGDYVWWLVPTISWAIIGLGFAWFLGFVGIAYNIDRKHHKVFVVEKKPEFESADGDGYHARPEKGGGGAEGLHDLGESLGRHDQGFVLAHETVYLSWVGRETLRARRPGSEKGGAATSQGQSTAMTSALAGAVFSQYHDSQNQVWGQPSPDVTQLHSAYFPKPAFQQPNYGRDGSRGFPY